MYAVMMLLSMYGQLSEQIMPQFISQREVYEERERPSKIYDWKGMNSGQDIYGRADFIGSADPEQPHD